MLPIRHIACLLLLAASFRVAGVPAAFEAGPYLIHLGTDHVTVAWETRRLATGRVEFYERLADKRTVAAAEAACAHAVALTGLKPGTAYHYRVVVGDQATPFFSFATAPAEPKPFRFAAYGDSCEGQEVHRRIAAAIAKAEPAFVVHLGDMVPQGDKAKRWVEDFFAPARELLAICPIFAVCGDNDRAATASYAHRFGLAADRTWQSWCYGDAEFFALNSNEPLAPDSPQGRWLGEALAASRARWKIVVIHEPLYSCGLHGSHDGIRRLVLPLSLARGVDLVLSGHDHLYQRARAIGSGPQPAANTLVQVVSGGGGQELHPIQANCWAAEAASRHHFCLFDVSADEIRITAISDTGETVDRFVLSKKGGERNYGTVLAAEELEVVTRIQRLKRNRFDIVPGQAQRKRFEFTVRNPFARELRGELGWAIENPSWAIDPPKQAIAVPPGGAARVSFEAAYAPGPQGSSPEPVPQATLSSGSLRATAPGLFVLGESKRP